VQYPGGKIRRPISQCPSALYNNRSRCQRQNLEDWQLRVKHLRSSEEPARQDKGSFYSDNYLC